MMDCKRALIEASGDMEKAIEVLRKSGMAKAEKKSGRGTNQGKVQKGWCSKKNDTRSTCLLLLSIIEE